MISEMVETRDRIQNEFYEEFENMSQKFIGKPIDASVLYTLERYMEAVAQRISAENGVHIISGKVRARPYDNQLPQTRSRSKGKGEDSNAGR